MTTTKYTLTGTDGTVSRYGVRTRVSATVPNATIQALRVEAAAAGDERQVEMCDDALAGSQDAHDACAAVIADATAASEEPRPSRHGARQSNASRRAAGRVRLEAQITVEQRRRLQWIQDEDGHDLSTIVGCHIDEEWEERRAEREGRKA